VAKLEATRRAEQSVLGAMLRDNASIGDVLALLTARHFLVAPHPEVFAALVALWDAGRPADLVTLADELKRRGRVAEVGYAYLSELWDAAPLAANAPHYAALVRDAAVARFLAEAAAEIQAEALDPPGPAQELVESAERRIYAVAENLGAASEAADLAEALGAASDRIDRRVSGRERGLSTGLQGLDDLTGGLHPGELVLLAARPSAGKSALALSIARHAALSCGAPAAFVSLEMSRADLGERVLVALSGVDGQRVRHGWLSADEVAALVRARGSVPAGAMWVSDEPGQTALRVAAAARRLQRRHGIRLLVVDYLQLVEPEDRRANRNEQVSAVSRRLKLLALELRIPVLALAQLNREVEHRTDREPRLADLRDSGSLEQDADVVLLLWAPPAVNDFPNPGDVIECVVAKQRNGPLGRALLRFRRAVQTFEGYGTL
jgi:replicative DNA helicase